MPPPLADSPLSLTCLGVARVQVNNLREIQALRRLSPHPGIIKLCEVLYDQPTGRLALVFELMDMNIYELIRGRRHYLPEGRIKGYMYQLLKSMDHMHRNGIFHRDIKVRSPGRAGSRRWERGRPRSARERSRAMRPLSARARCAAREHPDHRRRAQARRLRQLPRYLLQAGATPLSAGMCPLR